jgi:hypothetical protein
MSAPLGALCAGIVLSLASVAEPLAAQDSAAAAPQAVTLSCQGSGSVDASQTSSTNTYNYKTQKYESGTATTTGRKPFTGMTQVEIAGAMGRIMLPKPMKPLMSNDSEGWFPIGNIAASDKEITGQISINGLNKPKMKIDRMTGTIAISGGFSDFTGQCQAIHKDDKPKF